MKGREVTPNRQRFGAALRAGVIAGGVQDCSPAAEGGFPGFCGSLSVLVFSCKPSLPFKVQHKLLIDHQ